MYRTIAAARGRYKAIQTAPLAAGDDENGCSRRDALPGQGDCIRMYPGRRKLHPLSKTDRARHTGDTSGTPF